MNEKLKEEAFYPERIERVWRALTEESAEWLADGLRAEPGHRFGWSDPDPQSPAEGAACEVQEVEAPHRLQVRLEQDGVVSVVTWTLEEREGGTRVTVEHEIVAVSLAAYRRRRARGVRAEAA